MNPEITVYGVTESEDTRRVRTFLASNRIHFLYVNVEQDKQGEQIVKDANQGNLRTPLVIVQLGNDSLRLRLPSNEELQDALLDLEILERAA